METRTNEPIMVETVALKKGKPDKRVFTATVNGSGDSCQFTLDTNRTFLCRKRFHIEPGCKVTWGEKSYEIYMMSIYRTGAPSFFAKEIEADLQSVQELKAHSHSNR